MQYPTIEEVNSADQIQLDTWMRFLPSPGMNFLDSSVDYEHYQFEDSMDAEVKILDLIIDNFEGWNPDLSKVVGWDR